MTIEPLIGDAQPVVERRFHFYCLGDFSGHQNERPDLTPQVINVNRWETLFTTFQPSCKIFLEFEGMDDFQVDLRFEAIRDFRQKALQKNVPMLATLNAIKSAIEAASDANPVATAQFQGPEADWLRQLAGNTSDAGFVDLLSMVDIGDGEADSGLYLKYLKAFFASSQYTGQDRSRVASDLDTVGKKALEQIMKNADFRTLEATWRGLAAVAPSFGDPVRLAVIDCAKEELCDAFFLNFVKPEDGLPHPIDLGFTTYELNHRGPDLHLIHHLGKMAHHSMAPFIFNASPELVDARTYSLVSHVRDIHGKLTSPAHIKWRKERDEPGAEWLAAVLNPWRVDEGEESHSVFAMPSLYIAGLLARRLATGKWPGEMLGASGVWDLSHETAATLDDTQAIDYAYEGIATLGKKHLGVSLMGMNMLADVKLTGPESLEAANFVDYTLPYRFFVGCASRYFFQNYLQDRDTQAFAAFLGLSSPEAFSFEEEDGQIICRFQAPFTIYGTHADIVIGAQLGE